MRRFAAVARFAPSPYLSPLALILACALTLAGAAPGLSQELVERGTGANLRGLDKVNATVSEIELRAGEEVRYGNLMVRLTECRYPEGDPAADAFAYLTIRDTRNDDALFEGWMLASSPALNALEHPRYDVWVLSCKTD